MGLICALHNRNAYQQMGSSLEIGLFVPYMVAILISKQVSPYDWAGLCLTWLQCLSANGFLPMTGLVCALHGCNAYQQMGSSLEMGLFVPYMVAILISKQVSPYDWAGLCLTWLQCLSANGFLLRAWLVCALHGCNAYQQTDSSL